MSAPLEGPEAARPLDKSLAVAATVIAFAVGCFHLLYVAGYLSLSTRDVRIVHLAAMLTLLFLTRPSLGRLKNSLVDRLFGLLLVAATLGSSGYVYMRWEEIAFSGGETVPLDAWVGVVVIALVLEAARRGVGLVLAGICVLFFIYPFVSPYLPGLLNSRGYSLVRISEFLTTTSQGIYGIPIGVSASYIILFTIFGAFLSAFGAGDFFFELANRITRGMRAAGAKTAVLFSTLLGMISGSAAGNVAVTGTLTIPMMKREGYQPHQAGAIEAVVSTGGQIMPPVMGAAAFIMAEIVGTPYANIMEAALVPALLFFASILLVVHLQALRSDIRPMRATRNEAGEGTGDTPQQPLWRLLVSGGQFIIPFLTLVVLMVQGYSPFKASFIAILVLMGANIVWRRKIDFDFFRRSATAIADGAKGVVPIAAACAAAGIISGTLAVSGLGPKISSLIEAGSLGIPFIALVLTMLVAIVLGMGLPTTAAYLILATVVAPALGQMGVPLLTAHLFVFFYGCISTITPPVALASYVAAGIAGADINKVGWTAFRYGLVSYMLPFMFFFGPALLLKGAWGDIAIAVITAGLGIVGVAAFIVGYLRGPLPLWQRLLTLAAGLALLHQEMFSNLAGLAVLAGIWVLSGRLSAARP